jgi:hypothetical protein
MNLKTKVDAWVSAWTLTRTTDTTHLNESLRLLLSDIFDEIDQRADTHLVGSVRRKDLTEIREELNIPRKP